MQFTSREIQQKYNKFAHQYDLLEAIPEILGVWRLRRILLQQARGNVLEVAAGTGKNFRYYPQNSQITAVDLSPEMLKAARKMADNLNLNIPFFIMDAESLAFSDHSFDTVLSSLTLCTFPDPLAALKEMARVCHKNGRILLLEHGRSSHEWLGRWQDRKAKVHAEYLGCNWNRDPLSIINQAGLTISSTRRTFFGIFYLIEACPGKNFK